MKYVILVFLILISPLLSGLILKVKAFYGSKKGISLFYPYYILLKLFKKSLIYSNTTTLVFKISPIISFTIYFIALFFIPYWKNDTILSFNYDFILIFYLFALGRFFTIIAAIDTGSPFEGMGASREAFFALLAEASLFMSLIYLVKITNSNTISEIFSNIIIWNTGGFLNILIILSLIIIMLTECSRVPVDDPATHLELTMIHEVMVLDNSGPDMALIHLGSDLKLLFYSSLISKILVASIQNPFYNFVLFLICLVGIYIIVGIIESSFARFKMNLVPKFILSSFVLSTFAVVLCMEFINV